MRINRSCAIAMLVAVGACSAFAQPVALSTSLANHVDYLNFGVSNPFPSQNLIGAYGGGYGGAFQPLINLGSSADSTATMVTVFCVDYQLDVSYGTNYTAQVTTLGAITPQTNNNVRYGNLDSVGAGAWSNSLTAPTHVDPNSAMYRYTLAADLVAKYSNSGLPNSSVSTDQEHDREIQEAVWYVTANTDYTATPGASNTPFNFNTVANGGNDITNGQYLHWINTAENDIAAAITGHTLGTFLGSWAVVSGPYPLTTPNSATGFPGFQTFLVKMNGTIPGTDTLPQTPEPGFYGLVAAGLGGLFFARRRKKA